MKGKWMCSASEWRHISAHDGRDTHTVFAQTKQLNIWTWSVYGPDFATKSFEQKYGIKVNCTFYHGNEELWSKMQAGAKDVDIVQPSNHFIQRFARGGLIAPSM